MIWVKYDVLLIAIVGMMCEINVGNDPTLRLTNFFSSCNTAEIATRLENGDTEDNFGGYSVTFLPTFIKGGR